ncbi:uncharacterized protein LOC115670335 [Syzygium oleosum]|uniref:uncharacterized protein LOC115670335 n=1 Tax=Syzygium oleosum TaxID=219896 RepID=UPI0011D23C9C|nr:uncharacterized protein LOC115670335 [Syzygium oleosum]
MYSRLLLPGDKKGAKHAAKELDSISNSFDESLLSRLRGLSPASVSLPWLSSAVGVLTFAHCSVKSLIHELKVNGGGDSLSSWYLDNSLKVLDVCNCISSEIERLYLRPLNLRIAIELLGLDGNPSEEEIHQARDLLADSEGKGGSGYVKSAGNIEELIRDLAASIGMSTPWWKVSPIERVVRRAIQAVSFVTAFVAGVISSALRITSGVVVSIRIPKEFPWVDSVRAIESAVIIESSGCGEARARKTRLLKELEDMEAQARHVLEVMDEVSASGGSEEIVGRLRIKAIELETATKVMSEGLRRLSEEVNELFRTVTRIRKEMADEFTASMRKPPLPKKPPKPGNNDESKAFLLGTKNE